MALTYQLITSTTLASPVASVTLSSIPATFDDLSLQISARCDVATMSQGLRLTANTSTSTNNSVTFILGNGSSALSTNSASSAFVTIGNINGTTSTANAFLSGEIYIPAYRTAFNKSFGGVSVSENNATEAYIRVPAILIQSTSAITSLTLEVASSGNFVANSSFYLYGIKNS